MHFDFGENKGFLEHLSVAERDSARLQLQYPDSLQLSLSVVNKLLSLYAVWASFLCLLTPAHSKLIVNKTQEHGCGKCCLRLSP
jgi:hypothetical protein